MKLSNGLMQFFWEGDSVTLRGYRWVTWRMGGAEGEGTLGQRDWPEGVGGRMGVVRDFLERSSLGARVRRNGGL